MRQADPAHISMLKRNNVAMALRLRTHEPRLVGATVLWTTIVDAPLVQSRDGQDVRGTDHHPDLNASPGLLQQMRV